MADKKKEEASETITDAHAAGDGASGRSKEAIEPEKEEAPVSEEVLKEARKY